MRLPTRIMLLSQHIRVETAPNLHMPVEGGMDGDHLHRLYGNYSEPTQVITLDDALAFERKRETFLHENLHAMCSITQLATILEDGLGSGGEEHVVSVLAPVMLAWLRDNPYAVEFLQEVQAP